MLKKLEKVKQVYLLAETIFKCGTQIGKRECKVFLEQSCRIYISAF